MFRTRAGMLVALGLCVVLLVGTSGCTSDTVLAPPTTPTPGAAPPPVRAVLPTATSAGGCFTSTEFGPNRNDFMALALEGSALVTYIRENSHATNAWQRAQVITRDATGPACVQSTFVGIEAVVPEGSTLMLYWHDRTDITAPWLGPQVISSHPTAAGCIIENSLGTDQTYLQTVVLEGHNLVDYVRDNSHAPYPWHRARVITTHATGPGCIMESMLVRGSVEYDAFEVVVPEGRDVVTYRHDAADFTSPWQRGATISGHATAAGCIIQSSLGGYGDDFYTVVLEGSNLVLYWHDNTNASNPWFRGSVVTTRATGPGCIVESDVGYRNEYFENNFDVVVPEGGNLVHYWRDNTDANSPWVPGDIVNYRGRSQKICQLTGDYDRQFGPSAQTMNRTQTQFSVEGQDLGYPVAYGGRTYFLFGDTAGTGADGPDSIAWTADTNPDACLHLQYVAGSDGRFQPVTIYTTQYIGPFAPTVSLGPFEVPTGGFSANGHFYIFAWTDHQPINGVFTHPGHSVLARSDNGGQYFQLVYSDLGRDFLFIAPVVVDASQVPGLPDSSGLGLLMLGTSTYRQSHPYLAYVSLAHVEDPSAVYYYGGAGARGGGPLWLHRPTPITAASDASFFTDGVVKPLFTDEPCLGETSMTYNQPPHRWLMLYNCDHGGDTAVIEARVADAPWGPWSAPSVIFDPAADGGLCHFIHDAQDGCDGVDGPVTTSNGGDAYAPYVINAFTRGGNGQTTIYYTLSTWNPYQVVLMRATLEEDPCAPSGPCVQIQAPFDGAHVAAGSAFQLAASVSQDGSLPDSDVSWQVDGAPIGTGRSLTTSLAGPGAYSITATAHDLATGASGSASSTLFVDPVTTYVEGADHRLWQEYRPFGVVPPVRQQVDSNVLAFQAVGANTAAVEGTDGKLWLVQAPWGPAQGAPANRQQVDANVKAFQSVDVGHVYVLGTDGKLWLVRAPWGLSGGVPQNRQQVDGNVLAFQALDASTAYVEGTDHRLWLEQSPWGTHVPPARQPVDAGVLAFRALVDHIP